MRKLFVLLLTVAMTFGAGSAFAQSVETGEGKDADGGPNPTDPTSDLGNQAEDPLFIGADDNDGNGVRVAVAVGDEGEENSVGRAGLALSADGSGALYLEDYSDGNQFANAVESANEVTGCALLPPDEGEECGDPTTDDSPDDAALIEGSA